MGAPFCHPEPDTLPIRLKHLNPQMEVLDKWRGRRECLMSLEGETNGHIFSEDKQFVAKLMYMTRKQLALPKEKGHSLYMLYLGSRSQLHPPLVDWLSHQESLYEDTLIDKSIPSKPSWVRKYMAVYNLPFAT